MASRLMQRRAAIGWRGGVEMFISGRHAVACMARNPDDTAARGWGVDLDDIYAVTRSRIKG